MSHDNSFAYTEVYLKKCGADSTSDDLSGEMHGKNVLLGYHVFSVNSDENKVERVAMKLADEEAELTKRLEKRKVSNKTNAKRYSCFT